MLNINEIESWKPSTREVPQERILPGRDIHRVERLPSKQETVLRLKLKNGKTETLYGAEAEAAIKVLEGNKV